MNGTESSDEGESVAEKSKEKEMASTDDDAKTPSNVDETPYTDTNIDVTGSVIQPDTAVKDVSVDGAITVSSWAGLLADNSVTQANDESHAVENGADEKNDSKDEGSAVPPETSSVNGEAHLVKNESSAQEESEVVEDAVATVDKQKGTEQGEEDDEPVMNGNTVDKVTSEATNRLNNESEREVSRTETPRRPADESEIDVSAAADKDKESMAVENGVDDSSRANDAAKDGNMAENKRQESDLMDSSNVRTDEESREEGVAGDTSKTGPTTASDEDSDDYVVSIESPTKKESEKEISRTHSDETTGSNYSSPVSPWAGLLSAVTKVKAGGVNRTKRLAEETKLPRIEGSPEDKKQVKEEEEGRKVDSESDVSVEDGHVVEFSSDLESNGSGDGENEEKNPYLVDDADSGRDTPKLKELSESASIAMSDLRNMWAIVNSRKKKEEAETANVQETKPTVAVTETESEDLSDIKGGLVMGYEADEEEVDDDDSQSSSVFLRKHTTTFLLGDDSEELAHKFSDHTYTSPTHCGICNGLLVGLWSQGLQCEICGLDVHRGEGVDGHDDCRKEALLSPCSGMKMQVDKPATTLREVMKKSPNFFQDVKEQMNRDIKSQVKSAVVATGVEGERSKKLRRFRNKLVPWVETVDSVEAKGEFFSFLVLMSFHIVLVNVLALVSFIGFVLALWPRHGLLTPSALRSAFLHDCTVLCTVHVCIVFLALFLRRMASSSKRKSNIFDQFLRDVFKIDAQKDLGISVAGATTRARSWSGRIVLSSLVTCCAMIIMWHVVESPVESYS